MANEKKKKETKKSTSKKSVEKKTTTRKKAEVEKGTPIKEEVLVKEETSVEEVEVEQPKKKLIDKIDKRFNLDILDILILVVITAIASCVLTGFILNVQYRKMNPVYKLNLADDENIGELLNVYSEVVKNYYEEVDKKAMVEAGINGMMKYLGDNYSIYLNPNAASDLNESLENTYEGIGIVTTYNKVYKVYDGTPAAKAGIKVDDVIIKVNGVEITEKNFDQTSVLIQNNDGPNEIIVKRGKEELTFNIEKATVSVPVVSSRVIDVEDTKIGYIVLGSFSSHSNDEFTEELLKLEKDEIDSLIIDLRGNTGGYLSQAKNIASLFLEKGEVIYSLETKDKTEDIKDETNDKRKYKVVILVNGNTASAAEVLTAALKDNYGATIVGKKTFGKGKVQNTTNYGDGSMIKYTSAKWLRPNGDCIDEVGIEPDYDVDIEYSNNLIYDKQIDKAIELLK